MSVKSEPVTEIDPERVEKVPTTGSVQLPPDPRSLEALGRHHTLEAAVAELVDNSIDANARHVLIRFVREGERLVRLLVVDDGKGMDEKNIDVAMTVGGARDYRAAEIGRFGLGLKAASFSQARSVTVVSRAKAAEAVGRRWSTEQAKKDYRCEIVAESFASTQMDQDWGFPRSYTGTVIRWDEVKAFPHVTAATEIDQFLQFAIASIRSHIGLVFHRHLERAEIRVSIDVWAVGVGDLMRSDVPAIDPFGYPRTGAPGWPRTLRIGRGRAKLAMSCHIWPGRSTLDQFKLDGSALERQGLYVYFNDRLVQRGGWNGLVHADKQLNLARVAINVDGDIDGLVTLNPEKNGVEVGPSFTPAVWAGSTKDDVTFAEYIERSRGVVKDANRRRRDRPAMLPAGQGFDPKVRHALKREYPQRPDEAIAVRWTNMTSDEFFEVDRDTGTLWLNSRYRQDLLGGRRGGLNDAPVVKALLFLLVENIFAGQNMGPRDKDNLDAWRTVLTAAAKSEAS